ncbi:MAG: MBL fold metallo-hydrolase [Elusimicrobiota bacterium]
MPDKYILITVVVGSLETNCYLLADASSKQTFIIDPGDAPERIIKRIEYKELKPTAIINTHGHADHIIGNQALREVYKVPLYILAPDKDYLTDPALNYSLFAGTSAVSCAADKLLNDGDVLEAGGLKVKVIASPGHTPGGMLLLCEDLLFTGDTLFCGSAGRTDLPGGDDDALMASLKMIRSMPKHLKILPGHGPACKLEEELKHNPYL